VNIAHWLKGWTARAAGAPIGIDFAAHRLNLVQAVASPAGPALGAAVSVPYPLPRAELLASPRALRRFVDGALASAPFQGRRVVSALPPADVRILPLTVHVGGGIGEAQAVAKAAADHLGDGVDDAVLDYYQVRGADADSNERQVLVAVAQRPRVLAYLAMLESARLQPVALDIGPAAIARLLAALHGTDLGQSVLLINFGVGKSFLTVIWGRRLMLDREIEFGEELLTGRLAGALDLAAPMALALLKEHGIGARTAAAADDGAPSTRLQQSVREILHPDCQALAEELARTQVYVASRTRGSTISRVYLNGSLARYPHIQDRIAELIDVPVQLLDPYEAFVRAQAPADDTATAIALAAGLALRRSSDG